MSERTPKREPSSNLSPAERFRRKAATCTEKSYQLTDSVLQGHESRGAFPFDFRYEAVAHMTPSEIFLYRAEQRKELLLKAALDDKDSIRERMRQVEEVKQGFIDLIFDNKYLGGIVETFSKDPSKPVTKMLEDGYMFTTTENAFLKPEGVDIDEEGDPIEIVDVMVDAYLAEQGEVDRILSSSKEVLEEELNGSWGNNAVRNRRVVFNYLPRIASTIAIDLMVEKGFIPEEHSYSNVSLNDSVDGPTVRIQHRRVLREIEELDFTTKAIDHSAALREIHGDDNDAYIAASQKADESSFYKIETFRIVDDKVVTEIVHDYFFRRLRSGDDPSLHKTPQEFHEVDPEQQMLLEAWLNCLAGAYDDMKTMNPDELRKALAERVSMG